MGRRRKEAAQMGRAIIKDRFRGKKTPRGGESFRHTTELNDGTGTWESLNLRSVTEQTSLDDFLTTAEMAGRDFTAERENVTIVSKIGGVEPQSKEKLQEIKAAQDLHKDMLRIPRRPKWTESTSTDKLQEDERNSFLEWRRSLARLQEEENIIVTPYEKNLEFWRQLWRVIERSDVIVQIVDARNPLLFWCPDLDKYVKEVDPKKQSLVLINKADFLTANQRQAWADFGASNGVSVVFWSAKDEAIRLKQEAEEEDDAYNSKSDNIQDSKSDHEVDNKSDDEDDSETDNVNENKCDHVNKNKNDDGGNNESDNVDETKCDAIDNDTSDDAGINAHVGGCDQSKDISSGNEKQMLSNAECPDDARLTKSNDDNDVDADDEDNSDFEDEDSEGFVTESDEEDEECVDAPSVMKLTPSKEPCENTSSIQDVKGAGAAGVAEQKLKGISSDLQTSEQLLDLFHRTAKTHFTPGVTTVGMVGYPNVGKSSTINTILQTKKVSVSATPGRTKHFQTLYVEKDLMLCDCPGLVFPSFINSKADLVVNGILSVDQLTDCEPSVALVCERIGQEALERTYHINLPPPEKWEDPNRPPSPYDLLHTYGLMRGFMSHKGNPDRPRAARYILKDYVTGKLLFCNPPPGIDPAAFQKPPYAEPRVYKIPPKQVLLKTKSEMASEALDREFFAKMNMKVHALGPHATKNYVRTENLQTVGADQDQSAGGSVSGSQSSLVGKPWKKHNNRNKKEKLRRVYAEHDRY